MTKTINELSTGAPVAVGDEIAIWDASASGTRKATLAEVQTLLDARYEAISSSGTLTVELLFGGANVGMTYTSRAARYVRVGSLVYVMMDIRLSAKGSSTGNASVSITGLPATPSNNYHVLNARWVSMAVSLVHIVPHIAGAVSTITLMGSTAAAATPSNLTDASFGATSQIQISGVYGL